MATSARKPPSPPAPSKNAELGSKGAAKREDAGSRVQTAPASKPGGKSATSVATAPESPSDGTDIGTPRDASPGTPGAATESTVLATGASRQERAGESGSGPIDQQTQHPSSRGGGSPAGTSSSDENPRPPQDGAPAEALHLSLEIVPPEVRVGEIVTIEIMATTAARIVDAPLNLAYDPAIVRFLDATAGDFLSRDGGSVVFLANGTSRPGEVVIGIGRTDRSRGMGGNGTLCRVRFIGVSTGAAAIRLSQAMSWTDKAALLSVSLDSASLMVH